MLRRKKDSLDNLETREVEFRIDSTEERTITGIAVPYGEDANIGGVYNERFARGAIDSVENVKLFYGHETPIGKVIAGRETDSGFEITAKLTAGVQAADETLALMRDGVLNKFSVGFVPIEQERDGNTITRTKVSLREVSVCAFPAYNSASITEVREESPSEPEIQIENESESDLETPNTELDIRQIQDEMVEIRRIAESNVAPATPVAPAFMKFRSQGEFALALAKGDDEALNLIRTYTPGTTADTYNLPGWVGFINNLISLNRPSWSVWSTGVLPAAGMTVDYAQVTTNGATAAIQSTQNSQIAQGNIVIGAKSANVKTIASSASLSRQLVERSTVPFLDTAFQAMSIAYANATNAAAVAAIAALDMTGKIMDCDGGTAKSILEGITDGAAYIKTHSGLNPEFILADPVAYKYLVSVADSQGRPLVRLDGGAASGESIGFASPVQLSGTIFGLPIVVDTTLSSGQAFLANSNALRVFESAGAPVRLVDDISGQSTLTNEYAVYGYSAITVPFEGAIVKLDVTA
jgi:hypothetical protein